MAKPSLRDMTPDQLRQGLSNLDDEMAAAAVLIDAAESKWNALARDRAMLEQLLKAAETVAASSG